jgi:hypothetical protein
VGKLRIKSKRKKSEQITALYLEGGEVVTDPAEINRLLRRDGFTVDELTGEVGVTQRLVDEVENKKRPS